MLDTIQCISHTVRMAYGNFNLIYWGDTIPNESRHFMMAICQGNGSAPQIWYIIISVVYSAFRSQGFGINFANSFTTILAQLVGFVYADNCNMVQSDDNVEATHSQMQLAISEMEDLISIAGGYLAPDKIAWYLVDYEWIQGKWKCTNLG